MLRFREWNAVLAVMMIILCRGQLAAQSRDPYQAARNKMVDEAVIGAGVQSERVIQAMRDTPRHEFVTRNLWPQAYHDMSLPIGEEQTISSPFIVAYMTEAIDPQLGDKVLEIGTGSGYQAAVLSPLVKDVYTIEIVPELGRGAIRTLRRMDYDNVHVKVGDGFQGWAEHAPFDKIIVTCSPEKVPQPLVDHLREGGRMVIPVGERYQQTLYLFTKKEGKLEAEPLRPTLFVPMTGKAEATRVVKPDPTNPTIINSGFEKAPGDNGHVPGWYYQRQFFWDPVDEDAEVKAARGKHFMTFRNKEMGRVSHAMQGFAIDGRKVTSLEVSAWVRNKDVLWGKTPDVRPMVVITLYDEQRKHLGSWWLGPWYDDAEWHQARKEFRVPPTTREGILRIGLFGATGEISFDDVQLKATTK